MCAAVSNVIAFWHGALFEHRSRLEVVPRPLTIANSQRVLKLKLPLTYTTNKVYPLSLD